MRGSIGRAPEKGSLLLIEAPAGEGKTALVREARTAAKSAGMSLLEAKGSELEQQFAFGVVRQLLEGPVSNESEHSGLFADGAAPAARLFDPDEQRLTTADVGFEALHSLYWLAVNLADQAPVAGASWTTATGSTATRCASWPIWPSASRASRWRCSSPRALHIRRKKRVRRCGRSWPRAHPPPCCTHDR